LPTAQNLSRRKRKIKPASIGDLLSSSLLSRLPNRRPTADRRETKLCAALVPNQLYLKLALRDFARERIADVGVRNSGLKTRETSPATYRDVAFWMSSGAAMTDEGATAREVHELLLSAHPELRDVSLAKAAQLANTQIASSESDETVAYSNDFQGDTSAAIQRLRVAIAAGVAADEGEQLLLQAISVAEKWATARE
jgi:hypothetical protein